MAARSVVLRLVLEVTDGNNQTNHNEDRACGKAEHRPLPSVAITFLSFRRGRLAH